MDKKFSKTVVNPKTGQEEDCPLRAEGCDDITGQQAWGRLLR